MKIYEIPADIKELFQNKETSYRIIDYSPEMDMDNIDSMNFFLGAVGISSEYLYEHFGTQVIIKHPDFDYKLVIDSGGLGDFFSHGFDVTLY